MKRRILFCLALLITAARLEVVQAQALRIDSISPELAEPGGTVVIRGDIGPPDRKKAIRLETLVNYRITRFYARILRWTPFEAEVVLRRDLPVGLYLVTVVYPTDSSRRLTSNNFPLTIREPAPPAQAGSSDSPVAVLANRCMRNRTSRSTGDYEISTGGMYAACETMRTIKNENAISVLPGDEITIKGDFGNRRADQHVALAKFVEVYLERQQRNEQRLNVSHLLQIVAWFPYAVRIRIGDQVRPDDYRLLILNRLSKRVVPGVYEQGSNLIQIRVRPTN